MVQGRKAGWIFQKGRRRARLRDYDEMFLNYTTATEVHSL